MASLLIGCGAKIDLGVAPGVTQIEVVPDGGSPGCGNGWFQPSGQFVSQPSVVIDGGSEPDGGPFPSNVRTYQVLVPNDYNSMQPYRVIFEGRGCSEQGTGFYAFQDVDMGQAIQVGLGFDPARPDQCYDDQNPNSNDFYFFPWLKQKIENELCVDTKNEFIAGYSSGAWLANQFGCKFGGILRGQVLVSGGEPPAQPSCDGRPIAAMFVHDVMDVDNSYAGILPACSRTLSQNGCAVTDCSNPVDAAITTAYELPSGAKPLVPTVCRQFNGCPAAYPVVFCTTYGMGHNDQASWVVPAFWDFMRNRLN